MRSGHRGWTLATMSSQTHHRSGTPAEWFEDAAFLLMLFSAAAVIAAIVVLLIVL
jgi:hypothetical protein